ncbi:GNAT family N-acetyltransferase [Streptomyces litchfieldiae]|uniref:GNAT family N-acetyltransferase n=1 Tax=Streptomyces litchfieldiae TaxID=3075543 RepID=A0ABU2MWG8_9ACTN|nr:GNAT family N-acetyltransferase [Streptomyces sp. DSM 44938]MDT0345996.1 GNAT family N-acetyltransferase [Streptomyces sp. DSM 44938]
MPTVVEVPQWQGSGSPTAPALVEGAARLAAMIPGARRHIRVDTGGTLAETARRVRGALPADGLVVTVGGDCGVELEPVAAALRRHGDRLNVVWFDAHGDLNSPATSPSGAFHGMVLRTLTGTGPADLVPSPALRPDQIALAGTRALDPAEADYIRRTGIGGPSTVDEGAVLYIHVDLDVLEGITSVGYPEPGGMSPRELTEAVAALAAEHEIVGLGITEYAPADPADEAMLRRLVPELVRLCEASRPWRIERRAARAWPARHVEERDGWLLRHTPEGNRKRSNSALPLLGAPPSVPALEDFYAERAMPVAVQVSPAEHHRKLDTLLADRGYTRTAGTLVMTADAKAVLAAAGDPAGVERVADTSRWPALFEAVNGHADSMTVIGRIESGAALLAHGTTGLGLTVTEDGWTGLFCMATHPGHRRRGVATAVLAAAARRSLEQGAPRLYLQVEEDNVPARGLYEGLGFTTSHTYHYRIRTP